ncbi:MAG: LytTR family transcriptional regulator [Clostridia bacterium]|nr:LytTR family transcriptional regulator [Clostridia bacterium]
MKLTVIIDKERDEEIVLYLKEHKPLEERIRGILGVEEPELIGYDERGAIRLDIASVSCFSVELGRTVAVVGKKRYRVDKRLYELSALLDESFIKINQSCIANIKMIERFDASLGGSLIVIFKDGNRDYVSRRQLKSVKERIGFKL